MKPSMEIHEGMINPTVLNLCHADFFITTLLPNIYLVNLQHSSCKHVFSIRVENSVDPDQMASSEAS